MKKGLRIDKLVKEMLFVDQPELYPDDLWTDFYETISVFLCDEDIAAIEARYGEQPLTTPWVRRQLAELTVFFRQSPVTEEIYDILDEYDRKKALESPGKIQPILETEEIIHLSSHGIKPDPFKVGEIEFASKVNDRPVYVWKHKETQVPVKFLENILKTLAQDGYKNMILIADLHLLADIPDKFQFPIPYDVLPINQGNIVDVDIEAHNNTSWVS